MNPVNGDNEAPLDAKEPFPTFSSATRVEAIGTTIGRYKLLSVLGEGGFGMVYLAEQQEPIRRRVALKVIKPGMDTKQVIARFEAERQALALLDHPNVARVLDAGTTGAGRPYFVMEYVKGIPITEYCDRYKLSTQDRLRLFITLCQAIQHAHQKGIIHRDIKPSNTLITLHDERPVPKIIDFGVAKALNQRLTERTLFTEQGQFIGTPEYVSPEQAEMTGLDVDTRTDVYSLGVLLYELLTGSTPFDAENLRSKSYGEMQRIIREQDPVRPSTKLSTLGVKLTEIAKQRNASPQQLRKSVRGDLDWIVMKTLAKDRARRYGTAQALGEDVQRHLNHEPVTAGRPGIIYRTRKFMRRHHTQVVVGCLVLAAATSSTVLIRQYRRAERSLGTTQEQLRTQQEQLAVQTAQSSLSDARGYYANGQYEEAQKLLGVLINSEYVGAQARLLRARLMMDMPDTVAPVDELHSLLSEPNEIACQAHLLLAKVYSESRADDDETARDFVRKASEHVRKAESLRSNSADVYFNQALLSDVPAERMELLEKALALNPNHLDSRRIRALAYWSLRKYDEMEYDATVMVEFAKSNPEGHALRAIARREKALLHSQKELLEKAIIDHTRAIELAPREPRFRDERRETYMRMRDYEKALADAEECARLSPQDHVYHFHVFCALTALGRYEQASQEYDTMVLLASSQRTYSEPLAVKLCRKYIRDTLADNLSWYPSGQRPTGRAYQSMHQAVQEYQLLATKAKRVVPEGFAPAWSPDGRELAYSRGPLGYTAIEVLNTKTGTTRIVSYSGFDPAWSRDGRYIAFVRHRHVVPLRDQLDHAGAYEPTHKARQLWITNADGTGKPRLLANGESPTWGCDSSRVYYYSPDGDGYLCAISTEGDGAKPVHIMRCLSPWPAVSPDEKYVAWSVDHEVVEVVELATGKLIASWCSGDWPTWLSNGKYLSIGGAGARLYDPEKTKVVELVGGRVARCICSPDMTQIAMEGWGGIWNDIWIARLDAEASVGGFVESTGEWADEQTNLYSLLTKASTYAPIPERFREAERILSTILQDKSSANASGQRPNWLIADVLNSLSMVYAASPDTSFRDGKKAVEYATKACELTHWRDEWYLDTLAAAYAESGDFKAAVEWQEKAIGFLRQRNPSTKTLADCETRLKLYQERKPYRQERKDTPPTQP